VAILILFFFNRSFCISVINITAWEVEALGAPFILLSICAYLYKRNSFLIGLLIAMAIMTRVTLVLAVIFFAAEVIFKRFSTKQFAILLVPVILALGVLGLYNNRRFHSFFETGYNYSITANDGPIAGNYKYGETKLIHVPANLYSFLIMTPQPLLKDKDSGGMVLKFPYMKINPWGLAIWFTSPLFLLLIFRLKRERYMLSAAITSFVLSLPVFLWYSIGYAQVGYRYALDFLPFLFLMLALSLSPKLSKMAIVLIIIGVVFNCIYSTSIWEMYPVFNIYPHP